MRMFALNLLALSLLVVPVAASDSPAPIIIGVSAPLTGGVASFGLDLKAGIDLALADINAAGGVLGRPLHALYQDDACDPKTGVTVASRFVTARVAMAVQVCSMVCMATAPVYAEENIPFFVQCNSDEVTAQGYANLVRVYPKNGQQATSVAAALTQHFSGQPSALVHANDAFDKNLADLLQARLNATQAAKPKLVLSIADDKQEDFSAIIAQLRAANITVVHLAVWPKAVGMILRQAAAVGYHPQFITTESGGTDDVGKIAGKALDGLIFAMPPDPHFSPAARPVLQALAARNMANRPYAVHAYMLAQVYAEAVAQAGSTATQLLLQTLKQKQFQTVMGPVGFAANGDLTGLAVQLYQWHGATYAPWPAPPAR
jgi:branched-chain amino acid transport system substrate-binding protein